MPFLKTINFIVLLIFMMAGCTPLKIGQVSGMYEEMRWRPMTQEIIIYNDSTFENFYYNDLRGSYGSGNVKLTHNKVVLQYSNIPLDSVIIDKIEHYSSDSTLIELFIPYAGFVRDVAVHSVNGVHYESISDNEKLLLRVENGVDSLRIVCYDWNKRLKAEFYVEVLNSSFIKASYYPSDSWYEFPMNRKETYKYVRNDSTQLLKNKIYRFKKKQ